MEIESRECDPQMGSGMLKPTSDIKELLLILTLLEHIFRMLQEAVKLALMKYLLIVKI